MAKQREAKAPQDSAPIGAADSVRDAKAMRPVLVLPGMEGGKAMKISNAEAIYKLDHGVSIFIWLCHRCLGERLTKGWAQLEKRPLPFPQPCQDCKFKAEHP